MNNWWVPGCTIGYEHTFINALADFLEGLEDGQAGHAGLRGRAANAEGLRRRPAIGEERTMGGRAVSLP